VFRWKRNSFTKCVSEHCHPTALFNSLGGFLIRIRIHYIYIALFWVLKALYIEGRISSSTTNVQHPPGDSSHIAPERPPHTSLLVERRQSDEANQCMGTIRPWWSEANGEIWTGCRGYTPTLFKRYPEIFNDHRESGPRFNVSSEGCIQNKDILGFLFWRKWICFSFIQHKSLIDHYIYQKWQ